MTSALAGGAVRFATWAFDAQDRGILSEHAGRVGKVTLDYSTPGQTQVTDSQGKVSVYHTAVREGVALVTGIDGPGCSTCGAGDIAYTYNSAFQLTDARQKDGSTSRYRYDNKGRTIEIAQQAADGARRIIAEYSYADDSVLPSLVAQPSINPDGRHQWQLNYNALGDVVEITERGYTPDFKGGYLRMQRTTRYSYANGRLASVDGPLPGDVDRLSYTYNREGRLSGYRDKAGDHPVTQATYDAYGRVRTLQRPNGETVEMNYTPKGQLQRLSSAAGTDPVMFEYDTNGNLTGLTGPAGQARAVYDDANRPVAVVTPSGERLEWV